MFATFWVFEGSGNLFFCSAAYRKLKLIQNTFWVDEKVKKEIQNSIN